MALSTDRALREARERVAAEREAKASEVGRMTEQPELLDSDPEDNPCSVCDGRLEYTEDPNIMECIVCGRQWALSNPDPRVAELEAKLKEATARAAELEAEAAVRLRALDNAVQAVLKLVAERDSERAALNRVSRRYDGYKPSDSELHSTVERFEDTARKELNAEHARAEAKEERDE